MSLKPLATAVSPANSTYVNALFPNVAATGIYSVAEPVGDKPSPGTHEDVFGVQPLGGGKNVAGIFASTGSGSSKKFPTGPYVVKNYFSRDFQGFEDVVRDVPLFKKMLGSSNGLEKIGSAIRGFARNRHMKEIVTAFILIKKYDLSILRRQDATKFTNEAIDFMSAGDIAKLNELVAEIVADRCEALTSKGPMNVAEFMSRFHRSCERTTNPGSELAHKLGFLMNTPETKHRVASALTPMVLDGLLHKLFDAYMDEGVRVKKVEVAEPRSSIVFAEVVDDGADNEVPEHKHDFLESMKLAFPDFAEDATFLQRSQNFIDEIPEGWADTEITRVFIGEVLRTTDRIDPEKKFVVAASIARKLKLHARMIAGLNTGAELFGLDGDLAYSVAFNVYRSFIDMGVRLDRTSEHSLRPMYLSLYEQASHNEGKLKDAEAYKFLALYYGRREGELWELFSRIPAEFRDVTAKCFVERIVADGLGGELRSYGVLTSRLKMSGVKYHNIARYFAGVSQVFGVEAHATLEGFRDFLIKKNMVMDPESSIKNQLIDYMVLTAKEDHVTLDHGRIARKLGSIWKWRPDTVMHKLV